jgi:hypothetical protein
MPQTLLLISSDPVDEVFAAEISKKAGLNLKQMSDSKQAAKVIADGEMPVLMVDVTLQKDFEKFEGALQESVGLFSDKLNTNYIHFISSKDMEFVDYVRQSPLFGHFVLKNYQSSPAEAGQHYGKIVRASLLERAFGLDHILDPGIKVQNVKITASNQKPDAVEAVRAYAVAAKFQARMSTLIANAVDELLLNAIYDAPVDSLGKPLYISVPRSTPRELKGDSEVEMSVGFDKKYVAVTITDHHGSVNKSKLLSHLSKAYATEEYKVKATVAGAGIGLSNVFRSGGSFLFACEAGTKTEVTVFFKRVDSYRDFRDQFRFISTQFYS